jgi:signal transduction histidine kinase
VERSIKTIEAAAGRMMTQITDLLDHTRAQAGRALHLALEPVDLVALLRGIVGEHQHATDLHVLELRCAEESLVAGVDRQRLERAVTNLVVNAIKYSPQGGHIVVSLARAVGPDGPWISIEVADSGVGIPRADLPHMFEQYYRASNVATTIPGNGIGLAGVRHVVECHGGTVTLHSTEGMGTTVTMLLPQRLDEEA